MIPTLSLPERVEQSLAEIDSTLIGAEARASLLDAARRFPAPSAGISLECHLQSGRVDLISRITSSQTDEILSRIPSPLLDRVLRGWQSPCSEFHRVRFIDLELDIGEEGGKVFACPSLEPWQDSGVVAVAQEHARREETDSRRLAFASLDAILDGELNSELRQALLNAYDALGDMEFIHLAHPLALRGTTSANALRIIVSLPRRRVAEYVASLGWRGDVEFLAHRCRELGSHRLRLDVDLDLFADGPGPRIGFNMGFLFPNPYDAELGDLLTLMREQCGVSERQAESLHRHFEHCWSTQTVFHRLIHFKFYWDDDPQLRAKAYLCFSDAANEA